MRYKKKKRQIVSAALAVVMAMQLCIPSATFAAVPTKKLKVITGFTELPEEVAHIQIPADAGESFEDYLNFPETIEASVVEYKNVNHQKNNADRDKGAEDEKAAADDRDKKEDSEIATGSNTKKENLNEEETPETENSENVPDSNDEEETPETENSENMPDSNNEEETPETENSENMPDSNDEEETPETENSENVPDSNDEEEADKQEVQEKDQQGTFLIATDSNGGDFLEDNEFEDEEISEDIPVLTDISVTWEPDENREDESGFYYYLPVLPREYILAEGVELPEIEVSMDGGIALLASTDTYNIANGGIVINSDTLEQYNDATITGSSTTNVILVSGVDATITISNLAIQIPIDKNATTASNWIPAIRLANDANLNLILEGENTLKGGDMCAAIEVPEGCTLTISGEGSLKATGGVGAGIGASSMRKGSLGTIEINGGNIKAYGSGMAAGIGGSVEGGIGTIVINGGTVYAKGGHGSYPKDINHVYGGAGIGGGAYGCVDLIEINGGNVTAYGGYVTNAGRHPGAAIGTGGGGAKPIGEDGYKYGDIKINGGTVSAIAYHNEVYAIGVAEKPSVEGTLVGSISISDQAVVNLNGGDYFPKSENSGLKNYTIQGTIADVRFTESTYPVTISVGGITWNAGTMKVSDYQVTLQASNYLKPLTPGTPVTVQVTVGDYVYQMEADVDDKNATITLKAATPLYETRLKFVSTAITSDQILQATDITIKQDDEPLSNQEGQSAAMVIPSMQISYDEANTGHLTVYLPENEGNTEISVTVPGLNDGNPITKSGETISTTTPNEIEMFHDDTVCSHGSLPVPAEQQGHRAYRGRPVPLPAGPADVPEPADDDRQRKGRGRRHPGPAEDRHRLFRRSRGAGAPAGVSRAVSPGGAVHPSGLPQGSAGRPEPGGAAPAVPPQPERGLPRSPGPCAGGGPPGAGDVRGAGPHPRRARRAHPGAEDHPHVPAPQRRSVELRQLSAGGVPAGGLLPQHRLPVLRHPDGHADGPGGLRHQLSAPVHHRHPAQFRSVLQARPGAGRQVLPHPHLEQ